VHAIALQQGPQRVVHARSDYVYDVEDLITKKGSSVHATRLPFYHDSSLGETAELRAHVSHQQQSYDVRAFRDLRYDAEQREYFVLVSWLGFDEADNTW
jgi:hypothetical protein